MGTLTKAFVVLVTILSVLLATLVVSFVANVENITEQRDQFQQELRAAQLKANTKQEEINTALASLNQQISALSSANTSLIGDINTLRDDKAKLQADLQSKQAEFIQTKTNMDRLTAATRQQTAMVQVMQEQLEKLRISDVDQKTKLIQMADLIHERDGQLQAAERQVRRQRELMVATQQRLGALEQRVHQLPAQWQDFVVQAGAAEQGEGAFVADRIINGQITQVSPSGDQTWVEINVGSNDSVSENMKFNIHRNNEYLASLIITAVDVDVAAGRLDFVSGNVRVGDQVQTGVK